MVDNFSAKTAGGGTNTFRSTEEAGVHVPHHIVDDLPLPPGASTAAKQESILTALGLLATAAKQDTAAGKLDTLATKLDTVITAVQAARPGNGGAAVTPDNVTALATPARAIFVGTGGNLVITSNGSDVTFTNVQDGTLLPITATHVKSTGTTALNIPAIY